MSQLKPFPKKFLRSCIDERDEFISKVFALSKKYGHNQIMIAFSCPKDSQKDLWVFKAIANMDTLVEFLEEVAIPSFKDEDMV